MTYEEKRELYEMWVDLKDFPNHQISTYGRVRNKRNGYVLKPIADRYGYLRVSIGNVDNVPIHRLVCKTFYGEPIGDCNQVNHIDCDRQNNYVTNLEWVTPSDNVRWAVTQGNLDPSIGLQKALETNYKPVRIVELDKIFSSVKECAEFLNVPPTNVSRCLVGVRKGQRLHGYRIEYVEED